MSRQKKILEYKTAYEANRALENDISSKAVESITPLPDGRVVIVIRMDR